MYAVIVTGGKQLTRSPKVNNLRVEKLDRGTGASIDFSTAFADCQWRRHQHRRADREGRQVTVNQRSLSWRQDPDHPKISRSS